EVTQFFGKHSKWGHYITEKGKDYRQQIITLIEQQNLDILTASPIKIKIIVHPPDRRRRDIDNLPKAVFDSLTHANFWIDGKPGQ
ncbi:RusA family crossover junction endodeoxyribonuclease, partial [Xenorhabdus sp. Flor]|uniref:RusA family crossover junction endodeoxyribonuclease n=1 Tax=Xenorhabdus cabanillasii TaxID=351673 RepID=UPI0019C51117